MKEQSEISANSTDYTIFIHEYTDKNYLNRKIPEHEARSTLVMERREVW